MKTLTFGEFTDHMVALYRQDKMEEALQLIERHLGSFPEQRARMVFWHMCLLSRTGRQAEVLSAFEQGLNSGLWWMQGLFTDPDLDNVRGLPEFQRLVELSQRKYEEARKHIPRDHTVLEPAPPASGRYSLLIGLHGRNANKETHLQSWEAARLRGWLVLSVQSTQPLFPGAYCWDTPAQGLADVLSAYEQVSRHYQVDPDRVILTGFSQGSGMAMYTALTGTIRARGFIGVASWWDDPASLVPQAEQAKHIRGYYISGEKDHTLDTAKEIRRVLKENNIAFADESHPDLGHEFPADFGASFEKAVEFILGEEHGSA